MNSIGSDSVEELLDVSVENERDVEYLAAKLDYVTSSQYGNPLGERGAEAEDQADFLEAYSQIQAELVQQVDEEIGRNRAEIINGLLGPHPEAAVQVARDLRSRRSFKMKYEGAPGIIEVDN